MPQHFRTRTYFKIGRLGKAFVLHDKISNAQNLDALIEIHDVQIRELLKLGWVLTNTACVVDFHFCLVEFAWDFYPGPHETAVHLQNRIVKALHLKNARTAWPSDSSLPRVTYYINDGQSALFVKVYIRPLEPDSGEVEFVRVELTGRTRWLDGLGLFEPMDFFNLEFGRLTRQVQWLDFNLRKLRSFDLNLLTGGEWMERLKVERDWLGIAHVITGHRKDEVCPATCRYKGSLKGCPLAQASRRGGAKWELVKAIRECRHSKPQPRFEEMFCKPSKEKRKMKTKMKEAYYDWRGPPPLFSSGHGVPAIKKGSKKAGKAQRQET